MLTVVSLSAWAETSLTPDGYPAECQPANKNLPLWLKKLVDVQKVSAKDYVGQDWYTAWESTTLSRCTDLTSARIHVTVNGEPGFYPVKTIHWRNDRAPLFRGGSGRTSSEIFSRGFYPWRYDGNLDMPSGTSNRASGIVNTGYNAYFEFEGPYGIKNPGSQGYLIDAPGGINYTATALTSNVNPANSLALPKNIDEGDDKENWNIVVFPGGIRREFIKGAFEINTKNHKLEYLPNYHYAFPQPREDEFDLILADGMDLVSIFPQGQLIGGISRRYKKNVKVILTDKNGSTNGCWHINLDTLGTTSAPLDLTGMKEIPPVAVVYAGSCGDKA